LKMAANLTKEQLRNELISHGVQPPSSNSRKDEFVKLYEQHVAPIVSLRGDFSSDEENDVNEKMEKTEKNEDQTEKPAGDRELICEGINVADLSDEELFAQLQSFGIPVGPIVDTTRSVYQKKLAAILEKGAPDSGEAELQQTNGDDRQVVDEKFSDSEDDVSVTELKLELAPDNEPLPEEAVPVPVEVINTPESLTSIRKRITDRPASSLNALPLVDKQGTPTPRPSIHSISSSSQYVYESRRLLDTIDGNSVGGGTKSSSGPSPKSKMIGYYVVLMVIFVVAAYVAYTCANSTEFSLLMVNMKQKLSQYLEKSGEAGPAEKMDSSQSNPIANEHVV